MDPGEIKRWLAEIGEGDPETLDHLLPAVYDELRRLAAYHLRRERVGHTLQPTAIVHEAYLRLADQKRADWKNKQQFMAIAGRMMRRVLVDYSRGRKALKRNQGLQAVPLSDALPAENPTDIDLEVLDECLSALEKQGPRQARIVELRYFAGLSVEETARHMKISPVTVKRDWAIARAWLHRQLRLHQDSAKKEGGRARIGSNQGNQTGSVQAMAPK